MIEVSYPPGEFGRYCRHPGIGNEMSDRPPALPIASTRTPTGVAGQAGISTATVLFTDLVGSTALRARLGEDAAERLRRAHRRLLAHAVATHGGTLVRDLGDGILATFAGAADAVAAAVAIQQAIEASNRRISTALAVRIGVSTGDVTWDGADPHGMPVVEAARLCSAAQGSQILVS